MKLINVLPADKTNALVIITEVFIETSKIKWMYIVIMWSVIKCIVIMWSVIMRNLIMWSVIMCKVIMWSVICEVWPCAVWLCEVQLCEAWLCEVWSQKTQRTWIYLRNIYQNCLPAECKPSAEQVCNFADNWRVAIKVKCGWIQG